MRHYRDIGLDSGVEAYDYDDESITVRFKGGATYLYTYLSAGAHNIEQMKKHAVAGDGLNGYINRYAQYKYAHKLA